MRVYWYYMRDDASFRQLTGDVNNMVWEISQELDAGFTAGVLCSKHDTRTIQCDPKNPAEFLKNCREFLFDVEAE